MREILARMSSLTLALKPSVSLMAQTSGEFLISISLSVQYLTVFLQPISAHYVKSAATATRWQVSGTTSSY